MLLPIIIICLLFVGLGTQQRMWIAAATAFQGIYLYISSSSVMQYSDDG
jgi:hypothetical protein